MRKSLVPLATRLAVLACLSSALSFAGNWSGVLADSRCWDSEENNTRGTSIYVDRDGNLEIRLCSPGAKTKSFAVVQQDGLSFKLDAAGKIHSPAKAVRELDAGWTTSEMGLDLLPTDQNGRVGAGLKVLIQFPADG